MCIGSNKPSVYKRPDPHLEFVDGNIKDPINPEEDDNDLSIDTSNNNNNGNNNNNTDDPELGSGLYIPGHNNPGSVHHY
tara:strand:+ start:7730 stop:7966 length:237 start_codon:yes stop_codon:yes gene_type:complete